MKQLRGRYAVVKMARVFGVSRSGYYKFLKTDSNKARSSSKAGLDTKIRLLFNQFKARYGAERITLELATHLGVQVSQSWVGKRMKAMGLAARCPKRWKPTTVSDPAHIASPNLLGRRFNGHGLGKAWVSDLTYIWLGHRWGYLTTVIDLADRQVIGWNLSVSMEPAHTSIAALSQALGRRKPGKGMIFHSDRGVQYTCSSFRDLLGDRPSPEFCN